jgi:hypothetical protein
MKVPECKRERDLVEAITSGRWPDACDDELRNHVITCGVCKDVVIVARALYEEHAGALAELRVPPAGLVWWRAELRARQEASRVAERPIAFAHAFAGACAIGVALALLAGMLPWVQDWLISFSDLPTLGVFLLAAFAALIVAAPLALYFVLSDK